MSSFENIKSQNAQLMIFKSQINLKTHFSTLNWPTSHQYEIIDIHLSQSPDLIPNSQTRPQHHLSPKPTGIPQDDILGRKRSYQLIPICNSLTLTVQLKPS